MMNFKLTWFEVRLCSCALRVAAQYGSEHLRMKYQLLGDRINEYISTNEPTDTDAVMMHDL